ncbi:hypothetical protein [Siphonobacter sp. SORGH_AS_0500]|uniref:hypothetical protein n=1 Tax=Siphonobacter sp. SORGH_AS_0500 TaxID=1864824 RepID=UPI0028655F28|nr:hypothetical protein [Siphonobacter sp. SORGH_AS_0500]MDR6195633.1 hypothetical protein [Siphonobacter sp. SORGH_AS_0500]
MSLFPKAFFIKGSLAHDPKLWELIQKEKPNPLECSAVRAYLEERVEVENHSQQEMFFDDDSKAENFLLVHFHGPHHYSFGFHSIEAGGKIKDFFDGNIPKKIEE